MQVQLDDTSQGWVEIYGFVMTDMGYDFGRMDPGWTDVMRPSKLPSSADEFGADGVFFSGVRQTRIGIKAGLPTALGELKTTFEWELFGVGVDAGQTTFRLRHAYGELGQLRRRAVLEPVHGHRRVPELDRVLGTERDGVLPKRPGAVDADPGRHPPDLRRRAAGRHRRRRPGPGARRSDDHRRRATPCPICRASSGGRARAAT